MPQSPRFLPVSAVVLVGAGLLFHQPLRRATLTILRFPFTVTKAAVRTVVTLPRLPSLAEENAHLRCALLARQLETAQLREALRHVQQAEALLQATPFPQGLAAAVIGRSLIPTQQTLLLDQGERRGLTLESVILDADGVIGRVTELHPDTALVTLLTDPESRVAGVVERSRETGVLVGRGQGLCEFIYLDANADVQAGDRVVTAGLGGHMPKGLLLGYVVRFSRDEEAGSAWASVKPAAHLGRSEEVLCLPSSPRDTISR